mmetsp:Transcript_5650/g.21279  ORF Transcript_5650/g.21279 Transcript_5650/m.21279 type:complete len:429 (-) Transcript_5650:187-1473(-)
MCFRSEWRWFVKRLGKCDMQQGAWKAPHNNKASTPLHMSANDSHHHKIGESSFPRSPSSEHLLSDSRYESHHQSIHESSAPVDVSAHTSISNENHPNNASVTRRSESPKNDATTLHSAKRAQPLKSSSKPPRPLYTFALVLICFLMVIYVNYVYFFLHILPLLYHTDSSGNLWKTLLVKGYGLASWIIFEAIFYIGVICYLKVVFCDPGKVPDQWKIADKNALRSRRLLQKHLHSRETVERSRDGRIRVCLICKHQKPDRAHHCSSCGKCVLRMDHHCPWVNNCVGWQNHKFFLLFIFYLIVGSSFMNLTLLPHIISIFTWNKPPEQALPSFPQMNILWCFFLAFFFGFSLIFFLLFHIKMVLWNETTIESMESWERFEELYDCNPYDTGSLWKNWCSVFGTDWRCWLLPTRQSIPGDGAHFDLNESV